MTDIAAIKDKIDIVQLIGEYLQLKKPALIGGPTAPFIERKPLVYGASGKADLALFWLFSVRDIYLHANGFEINRNNTKRRTGYDQQRIAQAGFKRIDTGL